MVCEGKGVLGLAVDDKDPLACRGTAEGTLGKKQRTEAAGKKGFEHFWIGHELLFDDQFDRQGGWVAVDIASQVEDPSLGLDDRSGGDEDFSGRLSGGDQESVETNVIDKATVGKIPTAVIAAEGDIAGEFSALDDEFSRDGLTGTDMEFFDRWCFIGIVFADDFEGHGGLWVDFDFEFGLLVGDAFLISELAFGFEGDFEFFG